MQMVVIVLSVFLIGVGLYGLVLPDGLVKYARAFQRGPGVWGGFLLRAVFAVALWFAAPTSATPTVFRVSAVLVGLGAIVLPVLGNERFGQVVDWGVGLKPGILRGVSLFVTAAGTFLLWAATPG